MGLLQSIEVYWSRFQHSHSHYGLGQYAQTGIQKRVIQWCQDFHGEPLLRNLRRSADLWNVALYVFPFSIMCYMFLRRGVHGRVHGITKVIMSESSSQVSIMYRVSGGHKALVSRHSHQKRLCIRTVMMGKGVLRF